MASTKAFYSQIAAGILLAAAIAAEVGGRVADALLLALRELPAAMTEVLGRRPPSPRRPIASRRPSATGRWWATA